MKEIMQGQGDTPPPSINGDDIAGMDDEDMYLDEVEEIVSDEEEEMVHIEPDDLDAALEPSKDYAAFIFSKHVGSVFCCDLHPDGKLAVTGGEDDKAYVWCVETGQVFMECVGHQDSVTYVGFSHDGLYLATADMHGTIKVWNCNTDKNQQEPWTIAFEYEAGEMTWAQWHFGAKVLIVGSDAGHIYVLKVPSGQMKVLPGHNCKVECGKVFHDGVRLAAGYDNGVLKIWDLKTSTVLHTVSPQETDPRITSIDVHPENNLVASICSTGKAELITASNGKVVTQMQLGEDLEAVAFADSQVGLLAFGSLAGIINIWDIARQTIRNQCPRLSDLSAGVTKMIWIKNQLVTGCLDGSIRVYEGRTGQRTQKLTGHNSEILDLCYNAKENLILSASDDGTARIFKYEENAVDD